MSKTATRILALDVAFCHTGVAILERKRQRWSVLHTECISTEKESRKRRIYETDDKLRRATMIFGRLYHLVQDYKPQLIAAELPVSGGKSAAAHASMGMAIAIIAALGFATGVPIRNYNWDEIKLAACDMKTAGKLQVQNAIAGMFPEIAEAYGSKKSNSGFTGDFEHIADALGAGLCSLESDVVLALLTQRDRKE